MTTAIARRIPVILTMALFLFFGGRVSAQVPTVRVPDFRAAPEAERIIAAALRVEPQRRIAFISRYFLGRKYHPETKQRIKSQRAPARPKQEAANPQPLPVEVLPTSFVHLDCMTYVEHVLALASADRPSYAGAFLPRLIDVMYDARGGALFSHLRNHFTSRWADVNERKGYLVNMAREHPAAAKREVVLNRVGDNRTFYVEDRFMIASGPQVVWYFPTPAVLSGAAPLRSGDIVALATEKEGLDVTHMGFFIEHHGKRILRHASYTLNRIVDQEFDTYLREKKDLLGLMVFRPKPAVPEPPAYRFVAR